VRLVLSIDPELDDCWTTESPVAEWTSTIVWFWAESPLEELFKEHCTFKAVSVALTVQGGLEALEAWGSLPPVGRRGMVPSR
jgi:hypothetical protein